MGFFSLINSPITSVSSALSSIINKGKEQDTPESMRKKHGFSDFNAHMDKLHKYNPEAELVKAEKVQSHPPLASQGKTNKPRK